MNREKKQLKVLMCLFVLAAAASATADKPAPMIREEQTVVVDGVAERWRLQWEGPTRPACSPDEPDEWMTCPCFGLAFGECGKLALVRERPEQTDERLPLSNIFQECPFCGEPGEELVGCLRRWDVHGNDAEERHAPDFVARVKARPLAKIMRFADYDHDGRATEFMLQVSDLPCGKRMCVVIGISRKNLHLHVFSLAENPQKPLVLQDHQWEALLEAKGPVKVVDWACGDHGADEEAELELLVDSHGIHAMKNIYECTEAGVRGRFLRKCPLIPKSYKERDGSECAGI